MELHRTINASAIILVHNHPSGDPAPSYQSNDITRQLLDDCEAAGVMIHDHVVIGKEAEF
ncbi:JAB domain-containing protein [uncultured Tateyamaria sp.]|uniref:JAB domain-containing protein n=1 Tax=uncultured Tateyamaria sp. TaxID=455651 RepID=UPI00344FD376